MKAINKFNIFLIVFAIIIPNISQSAVGDIKIGDYTLTDVVPSMYIIWNITEANNAYLYADFYYDHNTIMVGHQFKLTITGTSYIREEVRYYFDEYSYSSSYVISDNPCIIGTLEYYNKSTEEWSKIHQGTNIAILMYNNTLGRFYSAVDIVEKYFLIALPTSLNLSDFGEGILNAYYDWNNDPYHYFYNKYNISDYSYTTNTLNLTLEENSGPKVGYNYIKLRNDGIVSEWNYNYDTTTISAEYLSSGILDSGSSIPFGSEYLIFAGICIIGLIIVVRKHSSIKTNKN